MKFIVAFLAIQLFCSLLIAQITPVVTVAPPYGNKLSGYILQPNKINGILNVTLMDIRITTVYIEGTISTLNEDIQISTKPGHKPLQPITFKRLPTGAYMPYTLTYNDIRNIFDENWLVYKGISRDQVIKEGLPEDLYHVCLKVFDYTTGRELSTESCSNSFTISGIEAPVIVQPFNQSKLDLMPVQSIVFTWLMPPGAPLNTQYKLRIVEIKNGINANDALRSTGYPVFFETTVTGNTYLYSAANPALAKDKKYAFIVVASDPAGNTSFRNNGASEVYEFSFNQPPASPQSGTAAFQPKASTVFSPSFVPPALQLISATIKGKLAYKYKEDGKTVPMKNVKIRLVDQLVFKENGTTNHYKIDHVGNFVPNDIYNTPTLTDEQAYFKFYTLKYAAGANESEFGAHGTLGVGSTDAAGNFELQGTLPIIPQLSNNSLGLIFSGIKFTVKNYGMPGTDSYGNITPNITLKEVTGDIYRVWRVVVDEPYCYSPSDDIIITANGLKNVGTLYGYVRTYKEEFTITADTYTAQYQNNLQTYVTNFAPLEGMMAYAYRKYEPEKLPASEGDNVNYEVKAEGLYDIISASATNSQGKAYLNKLVRNLHTDVQDNHKYLITPDKTKDKSFEEEYGTFGSKSFMITAIEKPYNDQYETFTIPQKIDIKPLPPLISGTVFGALHGRIIGATVTLFNATNNQIAASTSTDNNGYFEVPNVSLTFPYKILITKQGYTLSGMQEINQGNPLKYGQRFYKEYQLVSPAHIHGYVTNEQGSGLECWISLGGANAETGQNAANFKPQYGIMNVDGIQMVYPTEFTVNVPKTKIRLLIDLTDENYEDIDTLLTITANDQEVGTFKAGKKMRRLDLTIRSKDTYQPIKNARVFIPGHSDTLFTDNSGKVKYNFLSSGTSDYFDVYIAGPKGQYYEPKIAKLKINNSSKNSVYSITINKATYISGFVKVGNKGIANATVRIDNGSQPPVVYANMDGIDHAYYGNMGYSAQTGAVNHTDAVNHTNATINTNVRNNSTDIKTANKNLVNASQDNSAGNFKNNAVQFNDRALYAVENQSGEIYRPDVALTAKTDQNGYFILPNVPVGKRVIIKASQLNSQYVGKIDTVHVPSSGIKNLIIQLSVYNKMNITKLYGFPMAVENLQDVGGETHVWGYISGLKSNDNFQVIDPQQKLNFSNIIIIPGAIPSGDTIPSAHPKSNVVNTSATYCNIKAYNSFLGKIKTPNDVLKIEEYTKTGGAKVGGISGNVKLDAANFQIANLIFKSDLLLSLVKQSGAIQSKFSAINADGSVVAENPKGFKVTDMNSSSLKFTLYGFNANSDANNTFLNDDSLYLPSTIHTNFTHIQPTDWNVSIGSILILPNFMSSLSGTDLDTLRLETWKIISENWQINSNGFYISKGRLNMNGTVVPFSGMKIEPDKISKATYDLPSLKLLDLADLHLEAGVTSFLDYDGNINSWAMRIYKPNATCASVTSLPAWRTTDIIRFNSINIYSNGLQNYFGIENNPPKLLIHNLLDFTPGQFFVGPDYINIPGEFNLDIPDCKNEIDNKDEFISQLQYVKNGSELKFSHKKFNFKVATKGVVMEFSNLLEQKISQDTLLARGTIEEDPLFKFKVRLIKTHDKTDVIVDPLPQNWNFSGGKSLLNITGSTEVINNNTEWKHFEFEGDVTKSVFSGAEGRLHFTVLGDLKVDDSGIKLTAMDSPFGLGQMTYDINNKCLIGSLDIDQQYGPVSISGGAQAKFDSKGWYFVGGGKLTMPGPIKEVQAGILFADYSASGSAEITGKFGQYTYNGNLPEIFNTKIKGFYFCGGVKMPVPYLPKIDLDLGVAKAYLDASYGGNVGFGAAFNETGTTYGIDLKAFIELSLGFDMDYGIYGVESFATGTGWASANGIYNINNGEYKFEGEGGAALSGGIHIWTIACASSCDVFNASRSLKFVVGVSAANPGGISFKLDY